MAWAVIHRQVPARSGPASPPRHRVGDVPHDHAHDHQHGHAPERHDHDTFDDQAETWDDDPGHEERQQAVARTMDDVLTLDAGTRALDVGGGTGRLSILLSDRVGSVTVTDPSAGMVRVAQQRIAAAGLGDRMRAVQADLATDRIDGEYDVAWSSLALHHVHDLDTLLGALHGLLAEGGRLAIADLERDPDGAFHADKVDFAGHDGFDRDELAGRLTRAGFGDVVFTTRRAS